MAKTVTLELSVAEYEEVLLTLESARRELEEIEAQFEDYTAGRLLDLLDDSLVILQAQI